MKRFFLALILKHNGALAGVCIFFLVMGASFHAMHGQFEQAARYQTSNTCLSRQNPTFNLFELFLTRTQ